MKRVHCAILSGEILSYTLIVTFIFADTRYNFTGVFHDGGIILDPRSAFFGACLIALVGTINVWLTWYYMCKSATVRDWLVLCAWTHRVQADGKWISLEEFLIDRLGFEVSHGLSDAKLMEMRHEVDAGWRRIDAELNLEKRSQSDADTGAAGASDGCRSPAG